MNRELLEKPFVPDKIKQRDGKFGRTLGYIEGHVVIQRLNDAFDGKWSFEILKHDVFEDKDEFIVQGKLTAENVVKTRLLLIELLFIHSTSSFFFLGEKYCFI